MMIIRKCPKIKKGILCENWNGEKGISLSSWSSLGAFFFLSLDSLPFLAWVSLSDCNARELNTEETVEKRRRINKHTIYTNTNLLFLYSFFFLVFLFVLKRKYEFGVWIFAITIWFWMGKTKKMGRWWEMTN